LSFFPSTGYHSCKVADFSFILFYHIATFAFFNIKFCVKCKSKLTNQLSLLQPIAIKISAANHGILLVLVQQKGCRFWLYSGTIITFKQHVSVELEPETKLQT